jgi:hypothetical protein
MESLQRRIGKRFVTVLIAANVTGLVGPLRAQDKSELHPSNSNPITIRMNNQTPRVLYETIAKLWGMNVTWDSEAEAQSRTGSFTVELSKATLREALDKVASVTKTSWTPVSETTILVALQR